MQLVKMMGLPSDHNSSYLPGAAKAPGALRKLIEGGMSNLTAENGCDLGSSTVFADIGDLALINDKSDFEKIKSASEALFRKDLPLFIGGDHSVTWPIIEGAGQAGVKPHLIHIDAHPDLYPDFEGNLQSHASPMVRVLENELVASLTQVGIRTMNDVQKKQAEKYGVNVYSPSDFSAASGKLPTGPTYLSIDLDGIDPAFAPGVSHHEPGGLSVRDVLDLIWSVPGPLIGADIVEYNPSRDINDMTAAVVLKLMKEVAARLINDHQ